MNPARGRVREYRAIPFSLRLPAHRRVDLSQKSAGAGGQGSGVGETVAPRQPLPPTVRHRVGYPRVAPVHSVLHQDEPAARPQVAVDQPHHGILLGLKVEGVGHHRPVQGRQVQWPGEVGHQVVDRDGGEALTHEALLPAQRRPVSVHRVDDPRGADELGQGQGEGTRARAEVGPDAARAGHPTPQQCHVIRMLHPVPPLSSPPPAHARTGSRRVGRKARPGPATRRGCPLPPAGPHPAPGSCRPLGWWTAGGR